MGGLPQQVAVRAPRDGNSSNPRQWEGGGGERSARNKTPSPREVPQDDDDGGGGGRSAGAPRAPLIISNRPRGPIELTICSTAAANSPDAPGGGERAAPREIIL